jgi:hypothetical protein
MDIVIMIVILLAITAVLVAREVQRNRRARTILVGDGYEVDLTPPWFGGPGNDVRDRSSESDRPQGVWSSWYRDGTLGAYVCTHVSVTTLAPRRDLTISSARLEIVDDPDGRQEVMAAEELPVGPPHRSPDDSPATFDIDASINVSAPAPGRHASLVLLLNLGGSLVERRLCAVEHRFVAVGAALREG